MKRHLRRIISVLVIALTAVALPLAAAVPTLPFKPTTITADGKFAADTHWYSINVRSGKFLYVNNSSRQIECSYSSTPTADNKEFLWTLTGNDAQGYRFYNYSTGTSLCMGANFVSNDAFPAMSSSAAYNTFRFIANGEGFSCIPDGYTDVYLNDKGNRGIIGYWESTSGATSDGSRMVFAEIEVDGFGGDGGGSVTPDTGNGSAADLIINEIQVANIDQYLDPGHNYGGWIELFNPTDASIKLDGLYVGGTSDKGTEEALFRLCEGYGSVPPHGFRNIWFDHYAVYDNKDDDQRKQVYWKLDTDGGTVRLLAADATTVLCEMTYPPYVPRASYARTTDGGSTWGWNACGTPEASNAGAVYLDAPQRLGAPEVSINSQVTTSTSLTFSVNIPSGARLYYTTDGSTPTEKSYQSSNGRFSVNLSSGAGSNTTKSYRFRLYADGYLPSPVVTRSFIYNNRGYKAPVIAITTKNDNLNSTAYGIYASGSNGRLGYGAGSPTNRNMDWERPVNFEYFDLNAEGNHQCVINQEADMSICGGWTRNSTTPPPFKIKAAEQYDGQNYLLYPVFSDKPYNKNRTLQMRRESNLNDVGVQEIARRSGLNLDTQAWEPAIFIINGENKGYISIREPNNKHFALANYGIDTDLIDVFEIHCDSNYVQSTGTPEAFDRWYDLAKRCGDDESAYRELCNILDVEEYFNYMAVELYCGNNDWPWNNFKGYRERREGAKFRMVLMDIGDRLGAISNPFGNLREYTTKAYRSWNGNETKVATIFFNMMRHPELRRRFIDTYCLVAYSVFDPAYVESVRADLVAKLNGALSTSGSGLTSTLTSDWQYRMLNALVSCDELQISKGAQFTINLQPNVEGARLHLNDLPIPRQRFNGTLFAPATLHAEAPAGYSFAGWTDAYGCVLCADTDWTITEGNSNNYGTVYASFTPDPEQAATLPLVRVNEVSASNDIYVCENWSRHDWVELYNTTDNAIDIAGMYLSDNAAKPTKWKIPAAGEATSDGSISSASTIIPAHGTLVIWCDKEPAGKQLHASFKLSNTNGCLVCLTSADQSWADQMSYNAHGERESFGRYPDGGKSTLLFTQPTIDAPNRSGFINFKQFVQTTIGVIVNTIDRLIKGQATIDDVNDAVSRTLNNQ